MSNEIKEKLGQAAAKLVRSGMVVGLGTGTTARFFIEHLGKRCQQEGLEIRAVATSFASAVLAEQVGIPVITGEEVDKIHLTVDGADQFDARKQLIKGLGGALLREKVVAQASQELVIIADETKRVERLGGKLPVEVVPFAMPFVERRLAALKLFGTIRQDALGAAVLTDNGNQLIDIDLGKGVDFPNLINASILGISGVVETGFFLKEATKILVGRFDGQIEIL